MGQYLGAGKSRAAEQAVWRVARYNAILMTFVFLMFIMLSESILGIFSTDVLVIQHGSSALLYISCSYILFAIGMVLLQAFNGAGDTVTPSKVTFVCSWLFQLPLAYLLGVVMDFGVDGVFMAIALSHVFMSLAAIVLFRKGYWKTKII
ncbi:MAG: hypothetical protein HRT37_25700 [Alteromonadaceae bacterium]|nr:hypothetical protein [Alteromonadaceae bacterium]